MAEMDFKDATGILTGSFSEHFPNGLNVMVVDDDQTCLKIISKRCWKCGYKVTACREANEALEILRKNRKDFDLVLSDLRMPDMNGFELLQHIGLELDLPVIMMTADLSTETLEKGVLNGACDFLPKPVTQESLENIWRHVLSWKDSSSDDDDEDENENTENENENTENENESASRPAKKIKQETYQEDGEKDESKMTGKKRKEATTDDDEKEDGSKMTGKKRKEATTYDDEKDDGSKKAEKKMKTATEEEDTEGENQDGAEKTVKKETETETEVSTE